MKRLHVEDVREPIIELLRENGPMTIKQIAEKLTERFQAEGKLEEEGLLVSMPAKDAPKLSEQWWLYKKDKAWMLVEDLEKYGISL